MTNKIDYDLIKKACNLQEDSYKIKGIVALSVLEDVDQMIEQFFLRKSLNEASIMLDVFGLLQSFFVGIDALYDLSIGTTKYKYNININQNETLKELKFIRNDIVGHPTHRTYQNGMVGFSMIEEKSIKRDTLSYITYVFEKEKQTINKKTIYFHELKEAYLKEKTTLLEELTSFLLNKNDLSKIAPLLEEMFQDALRSTYDLKDIDELTKLFLENTQIKQDSNHRFLWRTRILKTLYTWKDNEFQDTIDFIILKQIIKISDITYDTLNQKKEKYQVRLPKAIKQFYLFMRKNEDSLNLLDNLNDKDHPLHLSDINGLLALNPPIRAKKLLEWLKTINHGPYVYALGSILKEYKKNNKTQ
ncbi:conserved hypothetical protein [Alteracholeplasma palmae J233]|uniref:Uncharacterized protein n=1 Tax=Alteracholeplasma palmae (strain ATCC 49389 / J233) TaxID=1318466 RepID=U4KKM4_ALTPJ|nr:hypothetical protein [Alteracholeplasma palmae]CCV64314.1 conserved hypothetical protein [Alteracholeplasma palmae J233]